MAEQSAAKPTRAGNGAKRTRAEPSDGKPSDATGRRRAPIKAKQTPDRPTVLVVDDDADIREWLRLSLSLRGWTVEEAATAEDALERLEGIVPDVVLLDHQMPGMRGIDCAAAMRDASADLRIILASGLIDGALIRQARELQILPIEKADHARLFDLFELLAEQIQTTRASVR